jgi:membrane protease subunit HflK
LAIAALGVAVTLAGGRLLGNKTLLDAAVTLGLSGAMLVGVLVAQAMRAKPPATEPEPPDTPPVLAVATQEPPPETAGEEAGVATQLFPELSKPAPRTNILPSLMELEARSRRWLRSLGVLGIIRLVAAIADVVATVTVLKYKAFTLTPTPLMAGVMAAACLIAAAMEAAAAKYLSELDPAGFPESTGLARAARVTAWALVLSAISIGFEWLGQGTLLGVVHLVLVAANLALGYSLLTTEPDDEATVPVFPVDLGPLSVLGSRPNALASVLDAAERQLGIDLRSTWALTVVRRALEPLAIGLFLLAWLSTSLTIVGVEEQGLVERFGVPVAGQPLTPGIHVHWPWPIDRAYRLPVRRVQALGVGHEGEESGGPENVIWSVQHAANEFTLLLGNGRDLITIDAAIQYRIVDPGAWRHNCQNPAVALKALAYRAVMRNTVNRTLSEALSENVAALTDRMRSMVQQDADALGLGIQVIGFTVGGMHPPVAVAPAYEAVVSAQISKVTSVVNAQVFRNSVLPAAQDSVYVRANAARAEGAETLARAAGEAWSFRALEAQYRAAPSEYFFRRRLETLERDLAGRGFTVLDARFVRDGGELWVTP